MPRVEPLPIGQIDPHLQSAIKDARSSGVLSSTLPIQVWAHRPKTALNWLETMNSFYSSTLLDARLRELVRLKIASITRCKACQMARKSDEVSEEDIACLSSSSDQFSPQEQVALKFAELFAADYTTINDGHFLSLTEFFSAAAIVELNMFCALMLAGGRMTYVLDAFEDEQ